MEKILKITVRRGSYSQSVTFIQNEIFHDTGYVDDLREMIEDFMGKRERLSYRWMEENEYPKSDRWLAIAGVRTRFF